MLVSRRTNWRCSSSWHLTPHAIFATIHAKSNPHLHMQTAHLQNTTAAYRLTCYSVTCPTLTSNRLQL